MRLISRNESLQTALTSLINSMPKILQLQLLTMFFIFMFSIVQINLFMNKFYRCNTEHLSMKSGQKRQLIFTKWDCLNYGGEWVRPDLNFDSITNSFITLASLQTTEGWV